MGIGWPGWYTPTADSTADYIALSGAVSKGGETHNANVYGIWTIGIPANSQNQGARSRAADLPDGQGRSEVYR